MKHRIARAAALMLPVLAAASAWGRGTPAGTTITNQAEVAFSLGGSPLTGRSNVAAIDVAEIVDLELIAQTPQTLVYGGAAGQPILMTLANVGNGPEAFGIAVRHAVAGDDFDPTAAAPAIFFDSDGDGSFGGADAAYVPGSNDPLLLPDESVSLFVISDIPAGVADGDIGVIEVTAMAGSGAGAPGQSFAGGGIGGVDAVLGASGGMAGESAEYLVGEVDIQVVKSGAVRDPSGGSLAVAGAAIDYAVQIAATGTGVATGVSFVDPIPPGTSYLPGSLTVNGLPLTDAADADAGRFDAAAAAVSVDIGALAAGDPAQVVSFSVTID